MRSGLLGSRVVQIHPRLRCNLACVHCYSSSGPGFREVLSPDRLLQQLAVLWDEGYEVISFSGGEPLMYPHLEAVAAAAKRMGFQINLITNGMLLTESRLESMQSVVSRFGISLDGRPDRHNRIRCNPKAFDKMVANLEQVRKAGIPFGFAHCVTKESIEDLPWLLEFAIEQGAKLLQLHPLTFTGRAANLETSMALNEADLQRVWLIAELFKVEASNRCAIQLDALPVQHLLEHKQDYRLLGHEGPMTCLSDFVNPLVIDERGRMRPFIYDMPEWMFISGSSDAWPSELKDFKQVGAMRLQGLFESLFSGLADDAPLILDWYSLMAERARTMHPDRQLSSR
ncbi:MAG: MoaA/NifB/PqqE/SkfB family radical SAM enzyme [Candidatus Omnitrophota bacterium]|jgi:MoaA/NifB/PqqE/SkfB family radical SAM enzyme